MKRVSTTPRPGWEKIAEDNGFRFHHVNGDIYWDESVYYSFSLKEIEEDLEGPAQELAEMCEDLAGEIINREELLRKLAIPEFLWDTVRDSWQRNEPSLYGRFDFAYDGSGPAKLYEYNADTPTSLYEAAYFQWLWLEDLIKAGRLPKNADQFNSIQEKLVDAFRAMPVQDLMHFASMKDTEEDRGTVEYLRDCAAQAGLQTKQIYMEDIITDANGQFMDAERRAIYNLFKLYPWEYIWQDAFGKLIPACDTTFVEPAWKMVLSNKGILPLLWQKYPGHPNLLPAWFCEIGTRPLSADYVIKPLLSREGSNIQVFQNEQRVFATEGDYGKEGFIAQEFCPPPFIDGHGPVCGLWIVNGQACGMGLREDNSPITGDLARFVPHCII